MCVWTIFAQVHYTNFVSFSKVKSGTEFEEGRKEEEVEAEAPQ